MQLLGTSLVPDPASDEESATFHAVDPATGSPVSDWPVGNAPEFRADARFDVLLATLFGVTDEIHQYFVPGRQADVFDVVADAVGALAGALFVAFLSRVLDRRP